MSLIEQIAGGEQRAARLLRLMIFEEAASGQPLIWGNKLTLLRDGPEAYGKMTAAISEARRNINLAFMNLMPAKS